MDRIGTIGRLHGALIITALLAACSGGEKAAPTAAAAKPPACDSAEVTGLKLPAGFCATVFADNIGHARHLVVAPSGVVYVNTWSGRYYPPDAVPPAGGFLVALQDTQGTGKADRIERFGETIQTGGTGGTGIALSGNALYAEINNRIVRYTLPANGIVPTEPPETIVTELPLSGDHPMHPFIVGEDGALYIDIGSATNSCQLKNRTLKGAGARPCRELETRGGIWRYETNKTGQKFSAAERYATGIRNGEGFAIDPTTHRMFVTQHGRDQLHAMFPAIYQTEQEATLPAEEVMVLQQGGDYGWPYCYYDPAAGRLVLAPEYGGDGKQVATCAKWKLAPFAAYPAHWAPMALAWYDRPQFPERYRNGLFITFHGSWNRAPFAQQGYNLVFQAMDGAKAGRCEIFADGFAGAERTPEKAAHRPTGLAIGPQGELYVSDDVGGRIYRIIHPEGAADVQPAFTACPSLTESAGPLVTEEPKMSAEGRPTDEQLPLPPGVTREQVLLGARIWRGEIGTAACTGCHGSRAKGTPLGPDLTDATWLWNDGSVAGIAKSVKDGVPAPKQYRAGMPPMGGAQLTDAQVTAVADYVWALAHEKRP
jgi:glucose/arabinose dehydrogenase/cytochrome c5